tara:strand:- start:218 stop:430 length:213 start_codon:yes stop_codon:yes gene_type:complete
MPTLGDAPTLAVNTALANDDLIQIYDVSANEPRVMTVQQFVKLLGALLPTSEGATGEIWNDSDAVKVSSP